MNTNDTEAPSQAGADGAARPGIVIFAAVLNLLTAFFGYLATAILLGLSFLGAALRLEQYAIAHADKLATQINWQLGISLLFGLVVTVIASFATLFLFLGLGLLRGRASAWYLQVAVSVLGLFFVPFGTVVSAAILAMFFGQQVRSHFKV